MAKPERLSKDDAAILALESEAIAGHTLKLLVLEPGGPLELDRLRAAVAARLETQPRAMERIEVDPDSGAATWVEDERFDITAHVREREGTAGMDDAGLTRVAGEIMAEHLDHRRPLWAFDLVGPLADGREAIIVRIHHAMADGISCMRLLDAVLWEAEPARVGPGPGRASPDSPDSWVAEASHLPAALLRELGHRARSSAFDRTIGARRALAFASTRLSELKRIGAALPGHVTVNDVLLAGVAGGLREWRTSAGEDLAHLRAQIPVSLHHRDDAGGELGNRDSFLNIDLPVTEPDALARLERIHAQTAERKRLGDADELYDFFHALARVKHVGPLIDRLCASPHEFSLSVSNVPGPRSPVSVAGRRVERLCSAAEPADHHVLRLSAVSCGDSMGIGICTDPDALAGVAELAGAIERSLAELARAAAV